MTLTQLLGINLYVMLILSCTNDMQKVTFTDLENLNVVNFNTAFRQFCELNPNDNLEQSAVECSFFGDYKRAVKYATLNSGNTAKSNLNFQFSEAEKELIKKELEKTISDRKQSNSIGIDISPAPERVLALLNRPNELNEVFDGLSMISAKDYIIEKSKNHNFLLINEAHYNSQNRAFTRDLLIPLWEQGYRFLALETLGVEDTQLTKRRYPILSSGYYTKDPVFGNLVREALEIGYELISYEIQISKFTENRNHNTNTFRDSIQALTIYQKTIASGREGKVLIHAGYSHISEVGDSNYLPMGAQLKMLTNQDVLSVDQQTNCEKTRESELNPYYNYAINNYNISMPVVFVDDKDNSLVDGINSLGIDIQVYHPSTNYIKGRPSWLLTENNSIIDLPDSYKKYKGHLIQAFKKGEEKNAVPMDQFILSQEENALILPEGEYVLLFINNKGSLIGRAILNY